MASFLLCLLAMVALRPLAVAIDLIDRPGGRKSHKGDVPLVGGIAMLLGILIGVGLLPNSEWADNSLLGACSLLVTVGLIDDKVSLTPWTRLSVQITAAAMLMFGTGDAIITLGSMFGVPVSLTGWSSLLITLISVIAAINAANMLDGMDGLAGGISLVALAALAILAHQDGNQVALSISLVMSGAVAAFLLSNLPFEFNRRMHCFMGDSGSTLLGFSIAWLCISVTQEPMVSTAKPVTILWIVALPLFDLVWTIIRRCAKGVPPFRSDQDHLHHKLLHAGLSVKATFATMIGLAIILATTGIALDRMQVLESTSLVLLVIAGVLVVRQLTDPQLLLSTDRQLKSLVKAMRHRIRDRIRS